MLRNKSRYIIIFFMITLILFVLVNPIRGYAAKENNDAVKNQVRIPVLMYHAIFKDPKRHGEYAISPSHFNEDLKYLKENGYTSITTEQLINYVYDKGILPEKPVLLTFDDGHYNNICYAEPLLEKYGMKAVMFIVGEYSEKSDKENVSNANFSYVNWRQIGEISERGNFEIGNHTWGLHRIENGKKGVLPMKNEDKEKYKNRLVEDLSKLQEEIEKATGKKPAAFAYPFGSRSNTTDEIIREMGFKATFCSKIDISVIKKGDSDCLYNIPRLLRTNKNSAEFLISKYGEH